MHHFASSILPSEKTLWVMSPSNAPGNCQSRTLASSLQNVLIIQDYTSFKKDSDEWKGSSGIMMHVMWRCVNDRHGIRAVDLFSMAKYVFFSTF